MSIKRTTRGSGFLEWFLAKQRAKIANRLIKDKSADNHRILDIGCGTYPYFLITSNFEEKFGIDKIIDKECQKKFDGITLINFDLEKDNEVPFVDNFFDVVTMLAVFEHIEPRNLIFVIKEAKRVLKKNGSFVMTTPAAWPDKILKLLAKLNFVSPQEIEEHKHSYSQIKILRVLQESGFEKIKMGYFEAGMNIWIKAGNIKY